MTSVARHVDFPDVFKPVESISHAPLYAQIIVQVEDAIRRGLLSNGDFLPSERSLCEGFGVARSTLRRAMGELEVRGIVSRTPGRGTRIEGADSVDYRPGTGVTLFELISATDRQPRSVVTTFAHLVADEETSNRTGFPVGTELVHVVRERYASELPIALLEDYFLAEKVVFTREELEGASIEALLGTRGFTTDRSDYELSAVLIDAELSEFMDLPAGTPAIEESRNAHFQGQLLNAGRNIYHPVNCRLRGSDGGPVAQGSL